MSLNTDSGEDFSRKGVMMVILILFIASMIGRKTVKREVTIKVRWDRSA